MKKAFLFIFITLSITAFSQTKIEKEYRISREEVPENCLTIIESHFPDTKIKWIKEIGLRDSSVEAKFKYEGYKMSTEFSETGDFEDLEVEIDITHIYYELRHEIDNSLTDSFGKYKLLKVQAQYTDIKVLETKLFDFHRAPFYEIVISTKENGQYVRYECLLNSEGKLILKTKILSTSSNNLEF